MALTKHARISWAVLLLGAVLLSSGCMGSWRRESSPICNVPTMRDGGFRSNMAPINWMRLRQDWPDTYILGPGDVLGIYIESVLPKGDEPPPIHYPQPGSNLPPASGYPMPIRDDGTISLPYVPPIEVAGLNLVQAHKKIYDAYTVTQPILNPMRARIMVSLIRPRTYQVIVVREDIRPEEVAAEAGRGSLVIGSERRGAASIVELRAYENDVLHALMESGGVPGVEAKNEVIVLRGGFKDAGGKNAFITNYQMNGSIPVRQNGKAPNILRIPLRDFPGERSPIVTQQDIILEDGDIVYIQSRDAEVFYTGGLLIGGQHPIPRDFDIDVLGAIAMSGGSIAAAAGGSGTVGSGRGGVGSIFPPTRVVVIREVNGRQVTYELDVRDAITDPSKRILIQPDDFIMLEYTPSQVVMNMILNNLQVDLSLNSLWD